jgi:hypothetical protein
MESSIQSIVNKYARDQKYICKNTISQVNNRKEKERKKDRN